MATLLGQDTTAYDVIWTGDTAFTSQQAFQRNIDELGGNVSYDEGYAAGYAAGLAFGLASAALAEFGAGTYLGAYLGGDTLVTVVVDDGPAPIEAPLEIADIEYVDHVTVGLSRLPYFARTKPSS